MKPKTGKTDHHGSHPKVHKPGLPEATHTGINHGIARAPLEPGSEKFGLVLILNCIVGRINCRKFHCWTALQALYKMIPPVQTRLKGTQTAPPWTRTFGQVYLLSSLVKGMKDTARTDRPPGKVRREPGASRKGGIGRRNPPRVSNPTIL